jgi:ribosomal protein S18 acetylase RimI-like enzyme
VRPADHRRGYGRRLLEHVSRTALRHECSTLVLAVNKRNAGAIEMYRACGFSMVGAAVKDIGGGYVMDDYLMSRALGGVTA